MASGKYCGIWQLFQNNITTCQKNYSRGVHDHGPADKHGNITMLLIEQFLGNDENDYQRFVNACSVNRSTLEELMNVGCVSISGGKKKTRTISFNYQRYDTKLLSHIPHKLLQTPSCNTVDYVVSTTTDSQNNNIKEIEIEIDNTGKVCPGYYHPDVLFQFKGE